MEDDNASMPQRMQPIGSFALTTALTVVTQPMAMAKVLIQIGHEPMQAVPMTSIFGKHYLAYPNVFKYVRHIWKTDGFLGLYRGFGSHVVSKAIVSHTVCNISEYLESKAGKEEVNEEEDTAGAAFARLCKETTIETISRGIGTIASHPFHVIMVRSIAQYVGREIEYETFFGSVTAIFEHDGILGFFKGLIPRLVGETIAIWAVNVLVHVINSYLMPTTEGVPGKTLKGYTNAVCTLAITNFTYPFNLTSNIMIVNGSGLAAGSPPHISVYTDWIQCLTGLQSMGEMKRGSSLFSRTFRGPANFRLNGKRLASN